ncbi:MAG: molybdopterin molybdenumtransferase MoeA, partial [Sphingobacteriales bacterium]
MQEKTVVSEGRIAITDSLIQKGSSVRLPGAEIRRGATALHAGEKLTPAAVSYLAAIGVSQVSVYPLPVVTIIITGNEFQLPGMQPAYGKVFEANSSGLSAVLKLLG